MKQPSVFECVVIPLNKIHNRAGNITVIEGNNHIPFDVRRIYYLYDIPGGVTRGGHAHKELFQLVVAVSGSFKLLLDDGFNKRVVTLDRPDYGLIIVPGIWRELFDFSFGSICMVLASLQYDENDYLRTIEKFRKWKNYE